MHSKTPHIKTTLKEVYNTLITIDSNCFNSKI
jgi:hypothetical protein